MCNDSWYGTPPTESSAVDSENHHGADHRGQETGWLIRLIPAELASGERRQRCARDSQKNRHNEAGWISSRHQEASQKSNHKSDHN